MEGVRDYLSYQNLQIIFAMISVITSLSLVFWTSIFQAKLDKRLKNIYDERERIRKRERAKMKSGDTSLSASMRSRPLYERILAFFDIAKRAEDDVIALPLRRAGFRGRGPVLTYLAIKIVIPPLAFFACLVYGEVFLSGRLPFAGIIVIALIFAALSVKLPDLYLANIAIKRQKEMVKFWPDTLDLLILAIESGMSMESAFKTVSSEIQTQSIVVSEELLLTLAELSYLQDRAQALRNLESRVDVEAVRSVVTALLQSERYGTSIAESLRTLAQETRDLRMNEAEKKAAALPPRLTVPMILFFLPVLFAVIITPAILQILPML